MSLLNDRTRLRKAVHLFAWPLIAAVCIVLAVPGQGEARAAGNCTLHGSWMGYYTIPGGDDLAWWISTNTGMSARRGVVTLESPRLDATFNNPAFADVVGMTLLRGVWEKEGGKTYAWTVLGFGYDEDRVPRYIAKLSGLNRLETCNSGYVHEMVLEIFPPGADPYADDPLGVIQYPSFHGYRTIVDLP